MAHLQQTATPHRAPRHWGWSTYSSPAASPLTWIAAILVLAVILVLVFFDWNMLRGPIGRYATYRLHRQVRIDGDLDVHLWSWTPRADVRGLRIANTKWAGGGDMAKVGHLALSVRLLPLIRGKIELPLVNIQRSSFLYIRNLAGHSNWEFARRTSSGPLKLPAINRFLINDGKISIYDARKRMRFVGNVSSSESTVGKGSGFALTGSGTLNGQTFTAEVHGAPLLNVDQNKPYPFTLSARAGYTTVAAHGQITKPFDLGELSGTATFAGRDAAELYYVTGLVLPNTPWYQVSASIMRDGEIFRATGVSGRLGRSDISGDATIDASGDKTFVQAALRSRTVYFEDLGFLFGGGHGRRTAAAAPATTRRAAASSPGLTLAGTERASQTSLLLPDAPLDVDRVRQMNADVRYHAASIVSTNFPLRSLTVHARLRNGMLRLDPLSAAFAQGSIMGHAKIDASGKVPVTSLDLRVRDIKLQSLVRQVRGYPPIEGPLEARAILTGVGSSVHRAASHANGSLTFVVPHGQMRRAFAELLGINLINGGVALLIGDQSQTNIRCGLASFRARDGVLSSQNITIDTDVERGSGRGYINLKNETVGLTLTGDAKSFRLLRMNAPIIVTGSLSHPKVGVQASHALVQGGLAVALGALVNPVASLLATIDPGLAKDANCGALMAHARAKGAPVGKGISNASTKLTRRARTGR